MADYELLSTPSFDTDYLPPAASPSVPPDYIIQSGGGISNMHHGHPQGPYSSSAERSDVYGMSTPFQQTGFMNATRGNMYNSPDTPDMDPRTCTECELNQLPPYAQFPPGNSPVSSTQVVFNTNGNQTLIEPFDPQESVNGITGVDTGSKTGWCQWTALFYLVLIFFTANLWVRLGNNLLEKHIFKTSNITTNQMIVVTAIFTIILVVFTLWIGSSIEELEKRFETSSSR